MIKHVVMWKFKSEVTEADKLEMKRQLEAYAGHSEHLKVVEFVKPLVCERAVVDYQI